MTSAGRFGIPARVQRVVLAAFVALGILVGGAARDDAKAWSSWVCQYYGTYIPVTGGNGWPWLGASYTLDTDSQSIQLCFNTTGPNEEPAFAGGVVGVGFEEFSPYSGSWLDAAAWCLPDWATTGLPWCSTGASLYNPVPTVEVVDEPGDRDFLVKLTWNLRFCSTTGCTATGDTTEKTGAIVGTLAVGGGPAGSQGASVVLQSTEVWFDGTLVQRLDGTALAGAGVGHTGTPGAPQTTVTPNAAGPCVAGVCSPAYQVWVPGYGNSVSVAAAGTTQSPSVGIPTTGNGRLCVIDSDTGNCA